MTPSEDADARPPPFIRTPRPKKILVIGGGSAGIAALRVLVGEGGVDVDGAFHQVDLIERRDDIGGVWYLDADLVKREKANTRGTFSGQWPIPPSSLSDTDGTSCRPSWPSPAYPGLRGNVLPRFLSLGGAPPFPPIADLDDPFPTLAETQDYLQLIARPLRRHIQCNIECLDVRELPGKTEEDNRWAVRVRDWSEGIGVEATRYYDAVVLTVGWTDVPAYPAVPGLEEARSLGLVEHCKWYRGPEGYGSDSRIVVVGNANSGNDVAAQLASLREEGRHEPIYRVVRHKAWEYIVSLPDPLIKDVPPIESIAVDSGGGKVHVTLVNGSVISDVDRIIFASGYAVAKFPFVHLLSRQPTSEESKSVPHPSEEPADWRTDCEGSLKSLWRLLSSPASPSTPFNSSDNPERVPGLYWQFLHARAATLATINLSPTRIPFWTSDVQAHCLRAIWDGSMTAFPRDLEGRLAYETRRIEWLSSLRKKEKKKEEKCIMEQIEKGEGVYAPPEHTGTPSYHSLGLMIDDYGPPLRRMAIAAKPEWESKLPDWDEHAEERRNMHEARKVALMKRKERGIKSN
ncbi:hypothetical protein CBS101457_005061 [Exobasidium rhododendri]|nr:hypothetical protein CBS101457_005061 [Exobasidium rhododendri]